MTSRSHFTLSAALTALIFAAPPGHARPPVPMAHPAPNHQLQWDSRKFMHVGELRPGMRGYALTVFKGTKIEKFGIEILGVVAKFNEGKDYIMFRATSGPPVTRGLGIAEGMSGSPIYIGGRLVGAISLGQQFSKDPIGFATPIEDMFDAWSPDLPSKMPSISAAAPSAGTKLDSERDSDLQSGFGADMPLAVSGMNAQGISRLGAALAPFHFRVMAGAGMGSSIDANPLAKNPSLVPGSAVGVALVQGDFDANATGTVTYRDGDRLLLFGHPFQNLGPIDAALTTAYIVDVYPSYQTSFKLGSPIRTVGRIFQDRPFSVGGVIGPMPQMVPMTVSVHDQSIHRDKVFHVRVINHPLLTGRFIPAIAGAAIAQVHGDPGDTMATVTMDVDAEEIGHVRRTNTYYDSLSIDQAATGDLSSLMSLLSSNPFYPLAVKSVQMSVTIQNRHDTAEIDHLFVTQTKFAPGDTVHVGVVLKPYKQPLYTQMIAVKIPLSTPDGVLPLSIQGGAVDGGGGLSLLAALLGGQPVQAAGDAANIGQLVKQFEEKPQNNQLTARLTLPTSAVSVRGEKLSGLPPTLAAVMQSPRTTGFRSVRDEVKTAQTVPYVVSGSQTLNIQVQRKDLSDFDQTVAPSAPPAASPAGPAASPASLPPSADDSESMTSNNLTFNNLTFNNLTSNNLTSESKTVAADTTTRKPAPDPDSTASDTTSTITTTASTTTTADGSTDTSAPAAAKPVGRLPSVWRQSTQADFSAGLLQNVAVSSLGDVRLSPSLTKAADTTESYVWALQPDGNGGAYLATGDSGMVYKMDASGKAVPFFKTGELEATSLCLDDAGNLYVGTAPHGMVFRVTPGGKGINAFSANEKYVTALAYANREVYIATGGGTGRVYELSDQAIPGTPHVTTDIGARLFTSPEAHILSLAADKDGNLYAGSAPDGIVYKITRYGKSSVLYDAAEPNITALATDSAGNVYAGTSPAGSVYRIAPDGTAKRLPGTYASGITSLKTDSADAVYAASGSMIAKISSDDSVQSYGTQADPQFISLAVDPATQAVFAGTGTVGSVYRIGAAGSSVGSGSFQSAVHDAGRYARWGTLTWRADTPAGSTITLQTRSGDVARPDASWSDWSAPYTQAAGEAVTSPPARYLQYQAHFTETSFTETSFTETSFTETSSSGLSLAPKLGAVSVYYLPRNQPPTVSLSKPAAGDAFSKTASFQWSASDPDKDTLSYDLSYSPDSGKTWKPITTAAQLKTQTKDKTQTKNKTSTKTQTKSGTGAAASADASISAAEALQNAPASVQAAIKAQIAADTADTAPTGPKPAQDLKETSYSWDTTQVPDGFYQIEVVASDKPSNPVGALTAKAVSAPFLIANTAPSLTVETPTVNGDKSVTLHGIAQTGLAFVQAVQAKTDDGDPLAAAADDGLFDSPREAFTLILPSLTSGPHKIEVQALDQAGNKATQTVTVTVP